MGISQDLSEWTYQKWGTGYGNPTLMVLISVTINLISLMVAVVCTLTGIRDLEEKRGRGSVLTSRKCMHKRY